MQAIRDSYVAIFIVDVHDATVNSPFSAQYASMDTNIHMVSAGSLTDTQPEFVETEQPKQSIRLLKAHTTAQRHTDCMIDC